MLTFTILACLAAAAHAATTGYYYGPGLSGSLPVQALPSAVAVENKYDLGLKQLPQQITRQVTQQVTQQIPQQITQLVTQQVPQLVTQQVPQLVTQQLPQQVQHIPKKTLNVMFIMAPKLAAGKNIQVKINSPETETETVIYLLSKQNDASEILEKIQELQQSIQVRPEVMIIKYRTEEELESAVKAVQEKYNDLGGPTPLIDGGVAPVIDYPSVANQLTDH